MPHRFPVPAIALVALTAACALRSADAQRHGQRSSPPTAPPANPSAAAPLEPVSSGLGIIQFMPVNYGVPAPQALTRQLRFDDDRTRAAALSALGAPGQYLQHGHIPTPRFVQLDLAELGNSEDLDALLTVELDQHILTAVMVPQDGNWRRIATLLYPVGYSETAVTPSTWLHTVRSLTQPDRYKAVFRASAGDPHGNYTENEAQLRVLNGKAVVILSFVDFTQDCSAATPPARTGPPHVHPGGAHGGCSIVHRWFQSDASDPTHRFFLVSGLGHMSTHEALNPLAGSRAYTDAHLRDFDCQGFTFNEGAQRYEAAAPNGPCPFASH